MPNRILPWLKTRAVNMAASEKKAILLFLEQRLEDYAYSNDYDQDREDRYIQTKDITYPEP